MSPKDSFFYRQRQKKKRFFREIIIGIFVINILCYIFINYFFFPVKITNDFYEPWIQKNKTLWVKKINLKNKIKNIQRGDFILIDGFDKKKKEYNFFFLIPFSFYKVNFYNNLNLKRVVALPGEKIRINKKNIYIDGKIISMKFLNMEQQNIQKEIFNRDFVEEIFVPNNYIFVLNPNWQINNDSRKYGFLPIENITGKIYQQNQK